MLTHDELLSRIDKNWDADYDYCDERRTQALRLVLELHKPSMRIEPTSVTICDGCQTVMLWESCPTIRAIEKELQ